MIAFLAIILNNSYLNLAYCKTGTVGQQLSLTKLAMPVESLNFVFVNQCSPLAVLE